MTKKTSNVLILVIVLIVILTASITWKVSEWQTERANSQNAFAEATYSVPSGSSGIVSINLAPTNITEVN